MERRARSLLGSILAASCLVLLPAAVWAQADKQYKTDSTVMSRDYLDRDIPTWAWNDHMVAVEAVKDLDLNAENIAGILPLLQDLRNAERAMFADLAAVTHEMLVRPSDWSPDTARIVTIGSAKEMYRTSREKIWRTISDRIGSAKVMSLRKLVEPTMHRIEPVALTDRVQRIDMLIAQWDKQSADRIAATGITPSGDVAVFVTPAPLTAPGFAHRTDLSAETSVYYDSPPLTTTELIQVLENRLVGLVGAWDHRDLWFHRNDDLTGNMLSDMWDARLGNWK